MTELDNLIDGLKKQHWINVWRKEVLQDSKTKTGIHFKWIENETKTSRIYAYAGEFVRIEVDSAEKTVISADKVEYTPVTQMQWVATQEMKHWSVGADVYKHYKGGHYRVIGESTHSETGEKLINYVRVDCPAKLMWSRPAEMFHDHLEDGTKRFKLVREALK